jgi:large subunit ribosomal protein L7/L12
MTEKLNIILDQLKNLTLKEASELVKKIEEEFNVEAAQPAFPLEILSNLQNIQSNSNVKEVIQEPTPVIEEKTTFSVILEEVPSDKKIAILKIVRNLTGFGLKESKEIVDNPPKVLREALSKAEAESTKKELEEAGAKIALK